MKSRAWISVFAGLGLLLSGCQRETTVPDGQFRLTVQDISTNSDMLVSVLTIQVSHETGLALDRGPGHCWVALTPDSPGAKIKDGRVILKASRILSPGEHSASIQTSFRAETQNGTSASAGGPEVLSVPAATKLEDYFTVCATNGTYPAEVPIQVARINGNLVTMTVGKNPNSK